MADLYFKVSSDWEEVVRLRNEITRLETQLNQFNGKAPLDVLDKLCTELTTAKTRMAELVNAAAIEGAKLDGAFKKSITIDVSTPMGQLKAFDDELQKMSSNLNAYFDALKGKLQDFVAVLGDGKTIADNIKVNEENIAKIDELNSLNAELQEQIKQIQADLERQQAAWQQMQQAVASNKQAVDSLTQSQQQQAQASAEAAARMNAALDDEVRKNDAAKKSWEDKKAEIESLQAELQRYQAAYDKVMQLKPEDGRLKRWWRETQFASAANNGEVDDATISHVVGLNSKIEELKQRLKEAQKEEKTLSDQFAESSQRVDSLRESVNSTLSPLQQMQQAEDAASKALRLDEARGMLRGITQEMDDAIDKMRTLEGDAEKWRDYIGKLEGGDTSVLNSGQDAATELANARAELEKCETELEKQKKDYNDLAQLQENYKRQIVDASGHQARIRTRIMQAREDLMKMIADGKAGTPEFHKLAEEAGSMRQQMALANATMEYFANPTRHLAALKTGLQGVAGAASLVTGVMGVFNTNSEKMAEIQTKIQSYLGIIVGLESTYATVKKTSNLMQAVGEVQAWAMAKAKAAEVTATEAGVIATGKATAAQALFNAVAKANPYLLLATGIGLAVTAIYMLVKAFSSEEEAAITAEEAIKKHNETMKDTDRELTVQVENMLNSYRILQAAWRNLGNDMDSKNQFIANNQHAFEDLGLTIKSVGDAEVYLRKENESCVDAIVGKAQELIAENKRWRDSVANTASGQMVEYAKLQRKWNELGDDMKAKKKFVEDNKTAFQNLGFAVGSVTDAENILVQNTEAVVASIMARAKAAAYYDRMKELMAKNISEQEQIDIDTKRRQNDVQNTGIKISSEEYYRLVNANKLSKGGYDYERRSDGSKNYQQRYEWGDVYTSGNDFYLTQEGLKKYQQIKKQEIDAQAEQAKKRLNDNLNENLSYLQEGLTTVTEENKKILANAGIQEWKGGGGGGTTKGKTPDEITKDLIAQEQEASRQRQQNLLLQEQAVIDQMDDGAEKELAQMRLNHKKRMVELNNEEQDILNKKIETASKDAKGKARKGFYSTGQYKNVQLTDEDRLGVDSQRISEMEAYSDKIAELFKKIATSSNSAENRMDLMRKAYSDFVSDINEYSEQVKTPATATGDEQEDATKKTLENIQKLYQKGQDELYREQLSHLYDYLREFGTIQEQIYAIEKQYNDKIAAEKDENIKRQLQRQKEAAVAGLNAQDMAMNIDWSTAFAGVGNVLKEIAKETLSQVEAYMQKPEFKRLSATDKKSYTDLRDKLRGETGAGATSPFNFNIWGTIEKNVRDYQESVKKLKAAQEAQNAAIQDMKDADALYTEAVKSGSEDMIKAAKEVLEAAQDAVESTGNDETNAQDEADRAKKNLTDSTNAAAQGIQNFTSYLNEMSNGSLYGFANGITKLITSLGKGSDGIGKSLGELGGKIGGIIGAILQILDALGDDPAQFIQDLLDKIANIVEKILSTLLTEVVPAILEGVVNIIGAVIDGIGNLISFGGWGSLFGDHEQDFKDGLKEWENKIAANTYAVEQLTQKMTDKSLTPQEAQKERDAALSALRGEIASKRGTADYIADDSSSNIFKGYHSWYYKRNDSRFDYSRFNNVLAQHGSNTRVSNAQGVVGLSAEDIQILRTYAGEAWADYFGDVGSHQDPNQVKSYLEQIGDLAEKDKEIMAEWYASLTNMTFESLRDNFKSQLKDLSKDRDAFLDDFSEKMMDSLLDSMMSTSGLSQRLKEWQTKWGDYIASGNKLSTEEVEALREEYQKLIDEGIAMRDEAAKITGYDQAQAAKQEADKKGFQAMSQDTGEELNGRFTALQIAGENISAQMNVAVPILTGIGVSMSRTAEMVDGIGRVADDMLTNIVECYSELNMIRTTTDEMLPILKKNKETLEKIEKNTKNI